MEWDMEWNTEWNGIGNGTLLGTEVWNRCMEQIWNGIFKLRLDSCLELRSGTDAWNSTGTKILLSGTAAWNGSLEQMHGTELERKYFVWNRCMEWKSGTDAWNSTGTEILLSRTSAWNGSLGQMHGTELERKYFCLEQLHGTVVWNRCMEQSWNGTTLPGTAAMFCIQVKIWSWEAYLDITCDEFVYMSTQWLQTMNCNREATCYIMVH